MCANKISGVSVDEKVSVELAFHLESLAAAWMGTCEILGQIGMKATDVCPQNAGLLESFSTIWTGGSGRVGFCRMIPVPFQVVSHAPFDLERAIGTNIKLQSGIVSRLGFCPQR